MAVTLDEVAMLAKALPDVTVGERYGNKTYLVHEKAFAWERPFSKADLKRFGDEAPPAGPILAVAVADLMEKEAALEGNPRSFFTIPHFNGYAAILIQLNKATKRAVKSALEHGYKAASAKKAKKR